MSTITIQAIESKEFKNKLFGYDREEVDSFLDEICDEMERMEREIDDLRSRANRETQSFSNNNPYAPEQQRSFTPVPAPAPVAPMQHTQTYSAVSSANVSPREDASSTTEAAQKLLANAQKMYDEIVADARKEADAILEKAHLKADSGLVNLQEERDKLESEIAALKESAQTFRSRFNRLLQDQKQLLDGQESLFEN